jgi:hypothetical protein
MARENFSNLLFITEQSSLDKGFWERKNPAVGGIGGGSPPLCPKTSPPLSTKISRNRSLVEFYALLPERIT